MGKTRILITGGTGSIGRELAKLAFTDLPTSHITIFSRNEKDQVLMKKEYPLYDYVIGDIRDYQKVYDVCRGKDYVFHLAALKHVNICEEQPQEAIKSNVLGSMNVINACKEHGCKMINMSSDKAIAPSNVYGMTKYLANKMVEEAGYVSIISGNVLWTSGSVLPIWGEQIKGGVINLTSEKMTRFFVSPRSLASFMLANMDSTGVCVVPMEAFKMYDIAQEFIKRYGNGSEKINITGLRPGERLHEFRDESTSSETNICTDLSYIFL